MKKNRENILNLKRIKMLLGMITLSTVVSFSGCGKKGENEPFSEIVASVEGETCLDEYLESKNSTLLEDTDNLIEYINLSEKLNKLLKKELKDVNLQISGEEVLLSPSEITNLMYDYKADSSDKEITNKILVQNALINDYIFNEGYSIAANLEIAVLKASWTDSFGFYNNPEVSLPIIEDIVIPGRETESDGSPSKEPNVDRVITIGKNKYKIGDYDHIIEEIYALQENNSNANSGDGYAYKSDRNDMIIDSINTSEDILVNGTKPLIKNYKR